MEEGDADSATVLIADDEKTVADGYALRLQSAYETVTAYGGQAALETLEQRAVDVVLLDRRMPSVTGDEVLDRIREAGMDCRVVMLTAVDPGFDVIEMPFDDYLHKPVDREELVTAIEQQLRVVALEQFGEYLELLAKREVLTASISTQELDQNPEYRALVERSEALEATLSARLDTFEDLAAAFRDVRG
jgi:DNA-binding response OmpR family regulator